MISISNLQFTYKNSDFNLSIPSFNVERYEKVAIVGPSGSGKTTLLNLISGILPITQGKIQVGETLINSLNDKEKRDFRIKNIGFVFQDFELLDYLNAYDNILHPYRLSKSLKLTKEAKLRATQLANKMGVERLLKRSISNLSQGEKQRIAICRAMLIQPQIVFADEATGNLDPKNKTRIIDLLLHSEEMKNTTLLAVTHDHQLLKYFDHVVDFNQWINEKTIHS